MKRLLLVGILALSAGYWLRAQTVTTYTIIAAGTLANCAPVVAGQTQYCFAVEGLAQSIKGSAYVLVPTSAPVTSVNGQTGAVVLAIPSKATTVATTTLQ